MRYPFFAKLAGFQLVGDSGALCGHMLAYPLRPGDYQGMAPDYTPAMTADLTKAASQAWRIEKQRIDAARQAML